MYINEFLTKYFAGVESKVLTSLKRMFPIKDLQLFTADAQLLEFKDDNIQEPGQITIGSVATVSGKPAEGEYLMPDGSKLIFNGGKLTKKIEPTLEELKAMNLKLKAQLKETQKVLSEVSADFTKLTEIVKDEVKRGIGPRRPFKDLKRKPSGKRVPFHK